MVDINKNLSQEIDKKSKGTDTYTGEELFLRKLAENFNNWQVKKIANELYKSINRKFSKPKYIFILLRQNLGCWSCRYAINKQIQSGSQIFAMRYWYLQKKCMGCSIEGQKGITITNVFQKISDESGRKRNLTIDQWSHSCMTMALKCIQ